MKDKQMRRDGHTGRGKSGGGVQGFWVKILSFRKIKYLGGI
jgi:hypothetical protein